MGDRIAAIHSKLTTSADDIGGLLVDGFHFLALFAIGGATVWSAVVAFFGMIDQGQAELRDILLLFIYLELGAMVGLYFKTNELPVRYLIYVAITALTRQMIDHVSVEHAPPDIGILFTAGGVTLLAVAVLILRYGSAKYPSMRAKPRSDMAEIRPAPAESAKP